MNLQKAQNNSKGGLNVPLFHFVLVEPEIPGNTGSIARTALALNAHLHLIHPLGFELSEKAIRRAGLDYFKHVTIFEYENFDDFLTKNSPKNLILFSAKSEHSYLSANYQRECFLVFGKESSGLSNELIEKYPSFGLPILSAHVRSLNLASVATTVGYHCLSKL